MSGLRVSAWAAVILVAILLVDRVLLRLESRGWINYRRSKLRGSAATYHFLDVSSVFEHSMRQAIEMKLEEKKSEDKHGDPPAPQDSDDASEPDEPDLSPLPNGQPDSPVRG